MDGCADGQVVGHLNERVNGRVHADRTVNSSRRKVRRRTGKEPPSPPNELIASTKTASHTNTSPHACPRMAVQKSLFTTMSLKKDRYNGSCYGGCHEYNAMPYDIANTLHVHALHASPRIECAFSSATVMHMCTCLSMCMCTHAHTQACR